MIKITKWYFDIWACHYDFSPLQWLVFNPAHKMLFKEITRCNNRQHLLKDFKEKISILDIGCGTGKFLYRLNNYLSNVLLCGLDLSSGMIKRAIQKDPYSGILFQEGTVEDFPYADNSFDIITCSNSFHHYQHPDKVITEIYKILKPDGTLMIVDGCIETLFGKIIYKLSDLTEYKVYRHFADELRESLLDNGFQEICQTCFNFIPLLLTIAKKGEHKPIFIGEGGYCGHV